MVSCCPPSATNLVSVRNTRVFLMALTALREPPACWQWIKRNPSPKRRAALHTYLVAATIACLVLLQRVALYITSWTLTVRASRFVCFASGMWRRIRTIRTAHLLHSSQGLLLRCSHLPNACCSYAFLLPSATFYLSAIVTGVFKPRFNKTFINLNTAA